jgi:hypothetical protein
LVLGSENGVPAVEFIMQGHENEQVKNALAATIRAVLDSGQSDFSDIKIVELKNNTGVEIPFNKGIVPLMILTEPVLLGLVLIAALVFMERDEETIISYTVTPGRIHEYLGSKIILMLLLGFISTLLITALTVGFNVDWLELMLLLTAGSIFGSTLGLFIASFFDNISKAMMWIQAVSIILSAPQASYFVPSFAPSYIRIMPTYGLMFAIKEAVFPSGNTGIIYSAAAEVGIINIILYFLCTLSYSRKRARG